MRLLERISRNSLAAMLALAVVGPVLGLAGPALGQPPNLDPTEQIRAIEKIDFLVGEWRGEGWMAMGPDHRESFQSWELVRPKVGGTALLVDGLHKNSEGRVVHEAMAVITWDPNEKRYRFSSYLANGRTGTHPGHMEDGAFVWSIEAGPRRMRYTIRLDDEGHWFERGEMSSDGETWHQFFEMRLAKVDG